MVIALVSVLVSIDSKCLPMMYKCGYATLVSDSLLNARSIVIVSTIQVSLCVSLFLS